MTFEPLTDEEVTRLAARIVTREVFFTNTEEGVRNSFGGILALADLDQSVVENWGGCYAEMRDASPMAVNGWPMFLSVSFLHRDNLDRLISEIERMQAALR